MPGPGKEPDKHRSDYGNHMSSHAVPFFLKSFAQFTPGSGHDKGKHHIVFEPCSKRNMPSPPKFRNRPGKIRPLKVLRQDDAKALADAHRHIDVARKIRIQLYHIKDDRTGQDASRHRRRFAFKNPVHKDADSVRNYQLFKGAPYKPLDAPQHSAVVKFVCLPELLLHGRITVEGPLGDRRKVRKEQQYFQKISLRLTVFPSDIDHIPHRRQRIKRNAERHDNSFHETRRKTGNFLEIRQRGYRIFIENKQTQIDDKIYNLHPFSFYGKFFFDLLFLFFAVAGGQRLSLFLKTVPQKKPAAAGSQRGYKKHRRNPSGPGRVKDNTRRKQNIPPYFLRNEIIQGKRNHPEYDKRTG